MDRHSERTRNSPLVGPHFSGPQAGVHPHEAAGYARQASDPFLLEELTIGGTSRADEVLGCGSPRTGLCHNDMVSGGGIHADPIPPVVVGPRGEPGSWRQSGSAVQVLPGRPCRGQFQLHCGAAAESLLKRPACPTAPTTSRSLRRPTPPTVRSDFNDASGTPVRDPLGQSSLRLGLCRPPAA